MDWMLALNVIAAIVALVSLPIIAVQTWYSVKQLRLSVRPYAVFYGATSYMKHENQNSFTVSRVQPRNEKAYVGIIAQCLCSNGYMVVHHTLLYFNNDFKQKIKFVLGSTPHKAEQTEYYLPHMGFIQLGVTDSVKLFEESTAMHYCMIYSDQHGRLYCTMLKLDISKPLAGVTGYNRYSIEHQRISRRMFKRVQQLVMTSA